MRLLILVLLVVVGVAACMQQTDFLSVDTCLDNGGCWDEAHRRCEFTSQGKCGQKEEVKKEKPAAVVTAKDIAKIEVYKAARRMELHGNSSVVLRSYRISLGGNPKGHKMQEGDERTPEGLYSISGRNPKSSYHLSLRISYPNAKDKAAAARRGVSAGGDIMIHGLPNGFSALGGILSDTWTDGCIAVTNEEIEEIWKLVRDGTPIEIKP